MGRSAASPIGFAAAGKKLEEGDRRVAVRRGECRYGGIPKGNLLCSRGDGLRVVRRGFQPEEALRAGQACRAFSRLSAALSRFSQPVRSTGFNKERRVSRWGHRRWRSMSVAAERRNPRATPNTRVICKDISHLQYAHHDNSPGAFCQCEKITKIPASLSQKTMIYLPVL